MAKYSYELKKKVVEVYLNGEGESIYIAKKYNISDKSIVRQWVKAYNAFRKKGLLRSGKLLF